MTVLLKKNYCTKHYRSFKKNILMETYFAPEVSVMSTVCTFLQPTEIGQLRKTNKEHLHVSNEFVLPNNWIQYVLNSCHAARCTYCLQLSNSKHLFNCNNCSQLTCGRHMITCCSCEDSVCMNCKNTCC